MIFIGAGMKVIKFFRLGGISLILTFLTHFAVPQSVLESGTWYKIGVSNSGIHKITSQDLSAWGIDPASIDPRNIRIYGNGGKMLPQVIGDPRPVDLIENAVFIEGEADGSFDAGDFILFYGSGPDSFDYEGNKLTYQNNIYSDTTYYFIKLDDIPGLRIATNPDLGSAFPMISSFNDFQAYENDRVNLISSGRNWLGEVFTTVPEQSFDFQFPGIRSGEEVKVTSSVLAQSFTQSNFILTLNGESLGQQNMSAIPNSTYAVKGSLNVDTLSIIPASVSSDLEVSLLYDGAGTGAAGYLDYLLVQAVRDLQRYDDQTTFRSLPSTLNPSSTFAIGAAQSSDRIWDITDALLPNQQDFTYQSGTIEFGTSTTQLKEFVVFDPQSQLLTPQFFGQVNNQNLKGLTTPDLVIISHNDFITEANRLADLRRSHDGLIVEVVEIQKIYNEFSSGSQDVTAIRDFLKHLYDKDNRLKFVLLFGRASFDYKDFTTGNTNFIPTYESRNSVHPVTSYSSDDYYAFMEDAEGEWVENFSGDHSLELGVGRIPVTTIEEAAAAVDKLVRYSTETSSLGDWRNEIFFVADDGDGTDGTIHERQADQLATLIDTTFVQFNINKIYVDAFTQTLQPGGEVAPGVNEAIDVAIREGSFIMNFTGHGGEVGWTAEKILDLAMINNWENGNKLPLLVTATCEFGRHDDPGRISGGELAILNPEGGAIALVTSARPVASSTNFILNRAFYNAAFEEVSGEYKRMGEIFRDTKNSSLNGSNNRNFSLLGDPSLRLAFPRKKIRLVSINGKPVGQDTLKALSEVTIAGEIYDPVTGLRESNYSGVLSATLFDKESISRTLGNRTPVLEYRERKIVLFNGQATIDNGQFELNFVIPRNIVYQFNTGKLSMYATPSSELEDAAGANMDLVIGGTDSGAPADNTPPEVHLFMEDTLFRNGGLTSSNTLLIANLTDTNGINISGVGVGQNITATLDDSVTYILNEFYQSEIDDFTSGWVTFPINGLSTGEHRIVVTAWDSFNNSGESEIVFTVSDGDDLEIRQLRNYPNPFRDDTHFRFEHNRAGEDLEVEIAIYSFRGELVRELKWEIAGSLSAVDEISWDGRNHFGKKVEPGIYVYKVLVRSLLDGAKNQGYQKLVLIN